MLLCTHKIPQELENLTHLCWRNKSPRVELPQPFHLADKLSPNPSWSQAKRKIGSNPVLIGCKTRDDLFSNCLPQPAPAPPISAGYGEAQRNQRALHAVGPGHTKPSRAIRAGGFGYKPPTRGRGQERGNWSEKTLQSPHGVSRVTRHQRCAGTSKRPAPAKPVPPHPPTRAAASPGP